MSVYRRVLSARVKASATVLATGLGTAVATAALATPAAATTADPWAAVRQCESGGNYSINTGNGFYGAYQFTMQTWRGLGMSGLPSAASPAVQDQAARRLAAQYGMKPWPVCGHRYGGPPPSGGAHHVRPHAASTPSSVRLPSRAAWTTSSHRTLTRHTTTSGYHADPSRQPHWNHPTYRSEGHYRGDPSYQTDEQVHWKHRRYASAAATRGAVRVLGLRLVGQTRADVRLYQSALDRVGYHLAVDGRFGRHTRMCTMHFQAAHRLVVDGLAGPHTQAALLRDLAARH